VLSVLVIISEQQSVLKFKKKHYFLFFTQTAK